jgi:hypothetical protein
MHEASGCFKKMPAEEHQRFQKPADDDYRRLLNELPRRKQRGIINGKKSI